MADEQIRREIEQQTTRAAAVKAARLVAQQIQQHEEEEEDDDDGNMPIAQFLTLAVAPDRSSIVYPAFGRNDFQLRTDMINLEWLDSEPHASIATWDDLARKFCNKYFFTG
ncbi:Uncharacterized protein Adt_06106 [Abeliophyllum distichum]|uniref:Uncharacterized protein n=1 Tax=Abeliophyllum distichum TaxID=126358 RepID=A0ABD1V5Z5_9LAMI